MIKPTKKPITVKL